MRAAARTVRRPLSQALPQGGRDAEPRLGADGDLLSLPQDHWIHLRTTNVVESPFAAVRLRTDAARRYKKVANAEALIWKILMIAEKKFRRLNSPELLGAVHDGQLFQDGMPVQEINPKRRAA